MFRAEQSLWWFCTLDVYIWSIMTIKSYQPRIFWIYYLLQWFTVAHVTVRRVPWRASGSSKNDYVELAGLFYVSAREGLNGFVWFQLKDKIGRKIYTLNSTRDFFRKIPALEYFAAVSGEHLCKISHEDIRLCGYHNLATLLINSNLGMNLKSK